MRFVGSNKLYQCDSKLSRCNSKCLGCDTKLRGWDKKFKCDIKPRIEFPVCDRQLYSFDRKIPRCNLLKAINIINVILNILDVAINRILLHVSSHSNECE